jgi:branched-chain amino acid aminotransferase
VTRGAGDLRARPEQLGPARLLMTAEPFTPLPEALYARGVPVEIAARPRNLPGALDPAIKSGNLLNTLLARFEMRDPASFEVIMLNHRGELGEASLANLFLVDAQGVLRTPALDSGILAGITRGLVLELARAEGLDPQQGPLAPAALFAAREAFLTASTLEVMPIASVDGRPLPAAAAVTGGRRPLPRPRGCRAGS